MFLKIISSNNLSELSESSTGAERVTAHGGMIGLFGRFVEAVDEMNKIVLIPSRLQDIECTTNENVPHIMDTYDIHEVYKLLNAFRNQIVHSSQEQQQQHPSNGHNTPNGISTPKMAKHLSLNLNKTRDILKELDNGYYSDISPTTTTSAAKRKISQISHFSVNSLPSDDESTSTPELVTDMSDMAVTFYYHLNGLNQVMGKLIDTPKFIANKYEQNL
ncbi:uncharacterized protein LOC128958318 [Oppia nitens]|uniref:uncharacterized protein LOC128958318 n=1 Tax=Oppia nitens TaxID=1686743 RepID=UPI0023DA54A9|nr:uncharacterized protein LOC128958318 [Oppia nitens]